MSPVETLVETTQLEEPQSATDLRIAKLLETVGGRVRKARGAIGLSRRVLSERSGVSQRYLAQLESGQGNISLALLMRIAEALDTNISTFVDDRSQDTSPSENADLPALLQQATPAQRAQVRRILTDQSTSHRACRIALIGLRGAGKSTLGEVAAHKLGVEFVELNNEIERASGIAIDEVIELYGQEGYRQLEFQALERLAKTKDQVVIAVAGGIVSQHETFDFLLENYNTVWLKAEPEEHMDRVRAQGDERPMTGNPDAMTDLKRILTSREASYARATYRLDTSGAGLDETLDRLLDIIHDNELLKQ